MSKSSISCCTSSSSSSASSSSSPSSSSALSSTSTSSDSMPICSLTRPYTRDENSLVLATWKPDSSSAVSYSSSANDLVSSASASASTFSLSVLISGWRGLTSRMRCPAMNAERSSRNACAFAMRSMLALWPYLLATTMHGVDSSRLDTLTFWMLASPIVVFHHVTRSLNSALSCFSRFFSFSSLSVSFMPSLVASLSFLSSKSTKCCTRYSSSTSVK
mmetsp:Transcript_6039/g.13721  ORF Transcript_6039/g.13721 Transcript_6039/m.13721 type:complete len:218 (-) Transcript_6039:536-1189(-)